MGSKLGAAPRPAASTPRATRPVTAEISEVGAIRLLGDPLEHPPVGGLAHTDGEDGDLALARDLQALLRLVSPSFVLAVGQQQDRSPPAALALQVLAGVEHRVVERGEFPSRRSLPMTRPSICCTSEVLSRRAASRQQTCTPRSRNQVAGLEEVAHQGLNPPQIGRLKTAGGVDQQGDERGVSRLGEKDGVPQPAGQAGE